MGKYISCGQYNKNYKYIILGIFFNILENFIFGFDLNDDFKELLLFNSDKQKELFKHFTVHEIFKYIGVFIFSCVFYKIEKMCNKNEKTYQKTSSFSSIKSNCQIILIFNDSQNEIDSIILNFIFIITVYVCIEFLAYIFSNLGLMIFDYWMFELLIISYINAKMFKLKIYRHQMLAILFNLFICLLFRIPYFILSLSLEKDNKSLLNKSNWYWYWYVILGLFIYLIIITIRAYSYTKIKWFIDLKYISSTKLLIYIGFIGILISTISCVIETNIKCSNKINFCEVNDKNNNTYLDNFYIYYEKVSEIKKRDEIIYETCVILFGMISKFFAIYFDMMIIKNHKFDINSLKIN